MQRFSTKWFYGKLSEKNSFEKNSFEKNKFFLKNVKYAAS